MLPPAPRGPQDFASAALRRQSGYEGDAPPDPTAKRHVAPIPGRSHVHETCQRSSGEIHRPGVWPRKGLLVPLRPDADHQVPSNHAAAHPAVEHDGETAEHFFLDRAASLPYDPADALCQGLVVAHGSMNSNQTIFTPWGGLGSP